MIKRIPLNATQKALYQLLMAYQTTPVYDDVPECQMDADGNKILDEEGNPLPVVLPYITFGSFTCKPNGAKSTDISDISMQLHIWSEYSGKAEVNGIAEDIIAVIGHYQIDLSAENFNAMSQEYDMFEAFPEETTGYHGVITFIAKIQNLI